MLPFASIARSSWSVPVAGPVGLSAPWSVNGPVTPSWEYPPDTWQRVIAVDLNSVFYCCRAAIPHMRERKYGRIVKLAPCSMIVPGTLADWRGWTGLPFDESGDVVVPGALAPVHVAAEQDHAVYVEPNVWIHHRTGV